ncbi:MULTISPECIES: hypothetical protein [Bacillaceae]|uniref:Group-specific protein n=2 Tax=Oceanobacillus caeni TaxID=405946 RepID=A0ABR5MMB6_9BACI|nr:MULTISPECIES: hypothetical protein [Bacillaceae]KPH77624.1 hypothetical protein AFL42_03255 [Oceanobacillus caeni]MBU8792528.1 hypothetical protein [Oceanobacillus caeni]MED4473811.1 hypothetical protein [Oceanobacillus caeni]
MLQKTLLSIILVFFLFNLSTVNAQDNKSIEIMDIVKNEIIKTTPTDSSIQLETEKIIKEIDGVVKAFKPIPDKGYMIKIPLEPSYQLENKWINALIDEVIIIIPETEKPFLLIFDDENNSYFFTFQIKIDKLLKTLGFPI